MGGELSFALRLKELQAATVPAIVKAALPANTALLVALLSALSGNQAQELSTVVGAGNLTKGLDIVPLQTLLTVLGVAESLSSVRLADYALLVVAAVNNRAAIYTESTDSISSYFVDLTNRMYNLLGYNYSAVPSTPLASAIQVKNWCWLMDGS